MVKRSHICLIYKAFHKKTAKKWGDFALNKKPSPVDGGWLVNKDRGSANHLPFPWIQFVSVVRQVEPLIPLWNSCHSAVWCPISSFAR